jgi:translation initiation factor 2B subunit (eIF-2B alpha/beta/delta family)
MFTHQIQAGTMFELVKALNDGAETLKNQTSNSISLNAGCELFIAFVTLFPHDSAVCNFCAFFITFSYRSVRTSLI